MRAKEAALTSAARDSTSAKVAEVRAGHSLLNAQSQRARIFTVPLLWTKEIKVTTISKVEKVGAGERACGDPRQRNPHISRRLILSGRRIIHVNDRVRATLDPDDTVRSDLRSPADQTLHRRHARQGQSVDRSVPWTKSLIVSLLAAVESETALKTNRSAPPPPINVSAPPLP